MFYVYRADNPESLIIDPITNNHVFYNMDNLKIAVNRDARGDLFEDGDSVSYILIDLKNKTFKTITVYYVLIYTTEIEIEN